MRIPIRFFDGEGPSRLRRSFPLYVRTMPSHKTRYMCVYYRILWHTFSWAMAVETGDSFTPRAWARELYRWNRQVSRCIFTLHLYRSYCNGEESVTKVNSEEKVCPLFKNKGKEKVKRKYALSLSIFLTFFLSFFPFFLFYFSLSIYLSISLSFLLYFSFSLSLSLSLSI